MQAAIEAFAHKGYAGTSVNDILRVTGLSKPTLYYYFGSKEGLYLDILGSAYADSAQIMKEKTLHAKDCRAQLTGLAVALFEFATKRASLTRLVLASTFASRTEIPRRAALTSKRRYVFDFVSKMIRQAQKTGALTPKHPTAELSRTFLGAVSQHIRMWLLTGEGKLDHALAVRVTTLFLEGAATSKPGKKS